MVPTKRGIEVYHFLEENFRELVSEERTRLIEQYMDAVEAGRLDYIDVLRELFNEFVKEIQPKSM